MYPRVQEYQKNMHMYVAERGYVKTITGRLRFIPKGHIKVDPSVLPIGMSPSTERRRIIVEDDGRRYGAPFREASNTPCQGSVADVLMIAARNLYREWKERGVLYDYWTGEGKAKILSFVHDETICELREDFVEEGAADIQRHMENAVKLRVPMKAGPGVGRSWIEAYKDGEKKEKAA
jgi:DNA polymerase-1